MPEITVKIVQGSAEVSTKATSIPTNSLTDLLSSLRSVKEETNTILSKIVEDSKSGKQTRKTTKTDDEDEESSEDDDTNDKKKQKS